MTKKVLARPNTVVVRNLGNVAGVKGVKFAKGSLLVLTDGMGAQVVQPQHLDRLLRRGRERSEITGEVQEVDAQGGVILPGYHNLHYHTIYALIESLDPIYDVFGCTTKEAVLDALRGNVESRREKGLVVAFGLNTVHVKDLTAQDLDSVVSDVPMVVYDPSYHGAVLNTKALEILRRKVKEKTSEGSEILVGDLKPNGQITEDYVFLIWSMIDDTFGKDLESAAKAEAEVIFDWLKRQVKNGITVMHDMVSFTPIHTLAVTMAKKMWEQEFVTVTFPIERLYLRPDIYRALFHQPEKYSLVKQALEPWLNERRVGLKLFADGSIGSFTAYLSRPYHGVDSRGTLFDSIDRATRALILANHLGIKDVRMHAIGDDAIRHAHKVMIFASTVLGKGTRLGIDHFELSNYPDILGVAAEYGIVVCSQPNFSEDVLNYVGRLRERVDALVPIATILERRISQTIGDDGMPPGIGVIQHMTHHPNPEQRISVEDAIALASRTHSTSPNMVDVIDGYMIVTPEIFSRFDPSRKSEAEMRVDMGHIWESAPDFDKGVTHTIISGRVM